MLPTVRLLAKSCCALVEPSISVRGDRYALDFCTLTDTVVAPDIRRDYPLHLTATPSRYFETLAGISRVAGPR